MGRTLLENANYINTTIKPAIKSAIIAQGVSVSDSDSFLDYATKIAMIGGGGGGAYEIWDYIQSDGTQAIDTGHAVTVDDVVKVVYKPLTSACSWIFGATDGSKYFGIFGLQNRKIYYNNSGSQVGSDSYTADVYNEDAMTMLGSISQHLYAFGVDDGSGVDSLGTCNLYSLSINNNYYLPCKRKSDSAFGLWDVSNQTFLGDSAGGNAFVGGSKIMDI